MYRPPRPPRVRWMGGRRIRLIYLPLVAVIGRGRPQGTYCPPHPPGVRWVLDGWSEDTVNISTISSGHWGGGPQGMYRPPRPPRVRWMGGRRIRLIYLPLVAVIGRGRPQGTYCPPHPPGVRWVLDGWSEDTVNISTISSGHWGGGPQGMYRPPRPPRVRWMGGRRIRLIYLPLVAVIGGGRPQGTYCPPHPPGVRWVLDGWSEDTVNISTISSGHWGGGDLRVCTALPVHPGYVGWVVGGYG